MSKRTVPSKKRKSQGPVSQSPQVPPQGSTQSSSQVPPQSSSQGSSQVPPQGSSQVSSSKTFEKIITQNAKILQKLDILIASQKKIEERLEVPENNEDLIKVIKSFSLYIIYLYTN